MPESSPLATVKTAGVVELLVGTGVPLLGLAAALVLILFFVGAIVTHLRTCYFAFASTARFSHLARLSWCWHLPIWMPGEQTGTSCCVIVGRCASPGPQSLARECLGVTLDQPRQSQALESATNPPHMNRQKSTRGTAVRRKAS